MKVGAIEIMPIQDGVVRLEPTTAYAGSGATEADWQPHRGLLDDGGMLTLSFGGFLVRTGERLVLIDAGIGPVPLYDSVLHSGELLNGLAALGVQPGDVTDVLLTHLHGDHVGWTTHNDSAVFENAAYRCDYRDWEHFVGSDPSITRKLSPLESRLETWDGSGHLMPGIDTMAAPGHTPGSTILVVSSGTERAMLLGDAVHCAVELVDEEWGGMSDVDPDLAKRTRNAVARELEGTDVPVAAADFPGLQFGRLLLGAGRRAWTFTG